MNEIRPASLTPTSGVSDEEWRLRVELAACYRLVAKYRMTDTVYTHISTRLPVPERHFLINPYGLMWDEITASSLVKVGLDGNKVEPSEYDVNPAGFTIHSAIHMARNDVVCVLHTHTKVGVALSCLKEGLLPLNQFALQFYGRLAYHDYEGIALDLDERERLTASLADKPAMVLRNHGLLTVGRSAAEAFILMLYLERSCEVQLAAQATGAELLIPSPAVCAHVAEQYDMSDPAWPDLPWRAMLRELDREDPSFRS